MEFTTGPRHVIYDDCNQVIVEICADILSNRQNNEQMAADPISGKRSIDFRMEHKSSVYMGALTCERTP